MTTILKIVLIEDNPADAVYFQEQLAGSALTCEVAACADIASGARHLAGASADVVFLDLSLPGSDGPETVRLANRDLHDLPIVVLTGLEDEQVGLDSLRAGAQDYLIKGNTSAETISRAARYAIERHHILHELEAARNRLDEKVRERTSELATLVESLRNEVRQRVEAERQLAVRADQLRALAGELTLAEQRERRRMALILHDHLQQLLVAIAQRVALLRMDDHDGMQPALLEIDKLLRESINSTRLLTAELSPPVLHELGLSAGFGWLAQWMSEKHKLTIHVVAEPDLPPIAENVKVLLFESVRELLFNAVKHARVASVTLKLQEIENHMLEITVEDQGAGFDTADHRAAGKAGGFGLFSIRERLDLIGGRMEIQSAPGAGSRIVLTAPAMRDSSTTQTRA
jgi:signal transduction histidine kinase